MADVSIRQVVKSYGRTEVVHGLDLEIPHNEFLVMVGPSGRGKSTMLRHMIGAEQLKRLRDGTILINTARSALVDEAALVAALREKRFIAVIDVFDTEPLPADSPFRSLPNAILSPHAAGHTVDTHKRQGATAVEEIGRFLRGKPLRHEVTKAMLLTMA